MIFLSVLIYLPIKLLVGLSLMIVFGHNLLDGIIMQGYSLNAVLWYIFHQQMSLPLGSNHMLDIYYPVLPWIGVMALGYCFGIFYHKGFNQTLRKKYLLILGITSIALFIIIRLSNVYGDMVPWNQQKNFMFTLFSFINVSKYPPSLLYVLITIGPTFLVLYFLENVQSKITNVLLVFGRVPFFYYLLHVLFIHVAALLTKYLLILGITSIALFIIIRFSNVYGDMVPWAQQKNFMYTLLSFINVSKYPPSLLYVLITIGPTFLVLYFLENVQSKITNVLLVFGRVPFFYYLLHVLFIHVAALLTLVVIGDDWTLMILNESSFTTNKMADYGYSLWVVYLVWVAIVTLLYPFCKKYMNYKLQHKEKWWLSYL